MALKKEIELKNGVKTSYHCIGGVLVEKNKDGMTVGVNILSYVNDEIRRNDISLQAAEKLFRMELSSEDMEKEPLFPLLYRTLKEMPAFSGAEDC